MDTAQPLLAPTSPLCAAVSVLVMMATTTPPKEVRDPQRLAQSHKHAADQGADQQQDGELGEGVVPREGSIGSAW